VQAKDGHTRIRYVETLANRGQAKIGFGVLAGLSGLLVGTLGGAIGHAATAGAQGDAGMTTIAIVLGVGAAVASFLGLERILRRRAQTRTAFAEQALAQVAAQVRASIASAPVKARVAVTDEAEQEEAEAEQGEAEAEQEEAERS
jgi:hypothetical protein